MTVVGEFHRVALITTSVRFPARFSRLAGRAAFGIDLTSAQIRARIVPFPPAQIRGNLQRDGPRQEAVMGQPSWALFVLFVIGGILTTLLAAGGKIGPLIDMRAAPAVVRYGIAGVLGLAFLFGSVGIASRLLGTGP
jgi:hypothetical protein